MLLSSTGEVVLETIKPSPTKVLSRRGGTVLGTFLLEKDHGKAVFEGSS